MSRVHAFVDTMLFLHFRQLDEIDWPAFLSLDEVELVVAPVVWRQLDRHKDKHSVSGIRERAKTSVRKLRGWLGTSASGSVRPGVTVRLQYSDPKIDFAACGLSRDVEDDQLVATVIEYQQSVTEPIVLVTDDYLLATKARAVDLRVVEPPESDRLPDARSEEEKQIRRLEAENQRLRGRRAELVVSFDSGDKQLAVQLQPWGELSADEKEMRLARAKAKYPLRAIPDDKPPSRDRDPDRMAFAALDRLSLLGPSFTRQQDLAYNQQLEGFYQAYELYLDREHAHRAMLSRAVTFSLLVANKGTAVARDIDVVAKLHAPEDAYVVRVRDLKKPPAPKPPSDQPLPEWGADWALTASVLPHIADLGPFDVSASVEDGDEGPEIHAYIRKLKHTQQETFGPFALIFPSAAAIGSVQLTYTLNTEDLPENVEGTLHLVIATGEQSR